MPGPIERNLGGLATSETDKNAIKFFDFLRIDLPSPVGIVRFTNYPGGYVGDIDGSGSQSWIPSRVSPSEISWSQQTPADVAWVDLADLENVWSTLMLNYDIEDRPAYLWQGWFNVLTGASLGNPQMWQGRTEKASRIGSYVRISLVPAQSQLSVKAPFIAILPTCQNVYKDPFTCRYAGGIPDCDHSLGGANGCEAHSNVINFNGWEEAPDKPVVWNQRVT